MWPGGKGLGFKKHRPGDPGSWRLGRTSGSAGGPIGRPAGRSYKDKTFHGVEVTVGRPRPWKGGRLMVFESRQRRDPRAWHKGLGPPSERRPFQSALSGSRFFIPPPLVEVMIFPCAERSSAYFGCLFIRGPLRFRNHRNYPSSILYVPRIKRES